MPAVTQAIDIEFSVGNCMLFSGLDSEQKARIVNRARAVELQAGESLFQQGDETQEFFLLERGVIKLALFSPNGNEKIVGLIAPGETFAEALIFLRRPRYPVNATAIVPSQVLCFDAKTYMTLLHESNEACFSIMGEMSSRLHTLIAEIDQLTLHSATYRVVHYLLEYLPDSHSDSAVVKLDLAKHLIAARLSVTPETLSRCFSRLVRDALIEVNDETVTLLDVARMRTLLETGSI